MSWTGILCPISALGCRCWPACTGASPSAFFDVHLMISHPLAYVDAFARAGAGLINFHLESEDDPAAVLAAIRAAGCKTGMTIKPGTPAEALDPWLDQLDLVLVMSVEPGFGGPEIHALLPGQAGGPEGPARGFGPCLSAGSGRRRQR